MTSLLGSAVKSSLFTFIEIQLMPAAKLVRGCIHDRFKELVVRQGEYVSQIFIVKSKIVV